MRTSSTHNLEIKDSSFLDTCCARFQFVLNTVKDTCLCRDQQLSLPYFHISPLPHPTHRPSDTTPFNEIRHGTSDRCQMLGELFQKTRAPRSSYIHLFVELRIPYPLYVLGYVQATSSHPGI